MQMAKRPSRLGSLCDSTAQPCQSCNKGLHRDCMWPALRRTWHGRCGPWLQTWSWSGALLTVMCLLTFGRLTGSLAACVSHPSLKTGCCSLCLPR